jgi:hypothetical protein
MEYTALTDPFIVKLVKNGYEYEARIVYGRLKQSCVNMFHVKIARPSGIAGFCLMERPGKGRATVWVDEKNNESILYQLIGSAVADHLRKKLGVIMMSRVGVQKSGVGYL